MAEIIVGAGLAGLTCGRQLRANGKEVIIFEASDGVGGRVRSDSVDGFTLDRGFQVLFDSYPAVERNLDVAALKLSFFSPGAVICKNGRREKITDPRRDYDLPGIVSTAFTSIISLHDKMKMLKLASRLSNQAGADAPESNQSIEQYLLSEGISKQTIDIFFRPFYGGILLDRTLSGSAGLFQYYFAMLNKGHASLPAAGIGAVSEQLASDLLASNSVRLNQKVATLVEENGRVVGVRLADGTEHKGSSVTLAVDAPAASAVASLPVETAGVGVTTLYFAGDTALWQGAYLLLNSEAGPLVNNAQMLTNTAPSYAPPGKHLLGVTVLGVSEWSDAILAQNVLDELGKLFVGDKAALVAMESYKLLAVYRIPYAQPIQPPGLRQPLQASRPGLFLAGDWTASASINGAMLSGERAAEAVLCAG